MSQYSAETFGGTNLRHLAQVSSSSGAMNVIIDSIRKATDQIHKAGARCDRNSNVSQGIGEIRFTCAKRELGQKPKRLNESWIPCSLLQSSSRSGEGRSGDFWCFCSGMQKFDDLLPSPCPRQPSESNVPHRPSIHKTCVNEQMYVVSHKLIRNGYFGPDSQDRHIESAK
jgi:hypothetical protein